MKNSRYLLLLTALILILYACKKDAVADLTKHTIPGSYPGSTATGESHTFNSGGNSANQRSNDPTITVLGNLRINPYTVENMTTAYNTLNAVNVTEVATTNWYVKFCPQTIEEAAELFETDLNLYDYPLEYEVLEMGDAYVDPSLGPDDIPCFYAIVEPGYFLPVYGELVDRLYLSDYESELTEKAFVQTGNVYGLTDCDQLAPDWPECQCDEFLGNPLAWQECIDMLNSTNNGCNNSSPNWPLCLCDGYLSDPQAWQDCIDVIEYNPPPDPNQSCLNSNARRPSGYVKVQNTETLVMEGVRRVKIILKDTWFTEDEVWTDDNGCFRLNETYDNRNLWMWVKWKNDRCKIRGVSNTQAWKFWKHLRAMKDYIGKFKKTAL